MAEKILRQEKAREIGHEGQALPLRHVPSKKPETRQGSRALVVPELRKSKKFVG